MVVPLNSSISPKNLVEPGCIIHHCDDNPFTPASKTKGVKKIKDAARIQDSEHCMNLLPTA